MKWVKKAWHRTGASATTLLQKIKHEKSIKQRKEGGIISTSYYLCNTYNTAPLVKLTVTFQLFETTASLIITWQFHEQTQQWGSSQHPKSQKPLIPALLHSVVQLPWTTSWAQVVSRHMWGPFLKYTLLTIVSMHFICWKAKRGSKKIRELIFILAGNPLLLVISFNHCTNSALVPA